MSWPAFSTVIWPSNSSPAPKSPDRLTPALSGMSHSSLWSSSARWQWPWMGALSLGRRAKRLACDARTRRWPSSRSRFFYRLPNLRQGMKRFGSGLGRSDIRRHPLFADRQPRRQRRDDVSRRAGRGKSRDRRGRARRRRTRAGETGASGRHRSQADTGRLNGQALIVADERVGDRPVDEEGDGRQVPGQRPTRASPKSMNVSRPPSSRTFISWRSLWSTPVGPSSSASLTSLRSASMRPESPDTAPMAEVGWASRRAARADARPKRRGLCMGLHMNHAGRRQGRSRARRTVRYRNRRSAARKAPSCGAA